MEEASNNAIECGACHLQRSSSYTCVSCVRSLLRQQWDAMKIQVAEKDLLAVQANQALSPNLKRCHMIQALQAMASNHSNAINEERKLLQSELEQDRQKLMRLRAGLNQRKETLRLSAAQFQVRKMNGPPTITASINKTMDRWASVHQKLGHSRRVLVAELVTLFDLRHAPERRTRPAPLPETYDPLEQSILSTNTALTNNTQATNMTSSTRVATKKTTKLRVRDYLEDDSWNEYLIVGRPLPTGYFENYDTDEINTTIENVIHMMTLVACYLGIKLPFDTFTRSSKYYIQAAFTAGSKRAPLFLSESNIIAFAAGLGHLNYNIAYLCHSQGVHITLANATNTLENLLACCEAPNLGRYTNYASIVTKKPEDKSAGTHYSDLEDSMISPGSDDGDFETIDPYLRTRAPTSSKAQELNENVLWCPGQEPFDLNVHDLISVIRRRREEESPVWGGLHLQDAVAGNLNPHEDDYFMHEDQEEEDGMYTPTPENGGGGGVRPGSSQSYHDGSTATSLSSLNRRPAHPRDRRQQTHQDRSYSTNGDAPGSKGHHGQPENWTFLDVDIFRAPSSMNRGAGGNGVLGGRGWPDISKLKQIGSAVGGAAVGLVNGAANVGRGSFSSGQSGLHRDETSTGGGSRRGSEMSPTSRAHLRGYPTFSSSAPS
ncbi:hypothetical protein BG005_010393 [Podila minutissima]|nr:hypothetical protein BG005_010393 [Podila minutissima]